MGNAPIRIGIRLENSQVEAGGVLKGRIYLNIQGHGHRAEGIYLSLVGEEIGVIVREENDDRGRKEVSRDSTTLVRMDVPLVSFESGRIAPGQYEYPFEWPIPAHLPSSMHMRDQESHCMIDYKLAAYLDSGAGAQSDYTSTADVNIAGISQIEHPSPVHMDLEEYNIKSCCSHRGTMTLGWDADTTVAGPKQKVHLGIMGRNDSIVHLQCLRARIVETITWSAQGRKKTRKRTLVSTDVLAMENVLWRPLNHLPSRRERRRMRYESVDSHMNAEVLENRCSARLIIPADARDSYVGSVVQVRHSLIVSAVTPGSCCITSPESSVFMTIQRHIPKPITTATSSSAAAWPEAVSASAPPMFEDEIVTPIATATAPVEAINYHHQEPPMAVAEILPDNWTPQEAEVVVIPAYSVIPQASAARTPTTASAVASPQQHHTMMMPSAPQKSLLRESHQIATALADLQSTLRSAKDPSTCLEEQLQNPVIVETIGNLAPHEFVETLKLSCRQEVHYARHARLLAATMVPNFYCRHVLACLWSLPQSVRFHVLNEVAPLASDIQTQRSSVEQELDAAELREFQAALS